MPPLMADVTLAMPDDASSRLGSQCWPSSRAKVREIDAGSAKPMMAMTIPGTSSDQVSENGKSKVKFRKPLGSSPTTSPS